MDAKTAQAIYRDKESRRPSEYLDYFLSEIATNAHHGCITKSCPPDVREYVIHELRSLGYRAECSTVGTYGLKAIFVDWRELEQY